jgi:hypothetical protein
LEAEYTGRIFGTFVSAANEGTLDIRAHLETKSTKNNRGERSSSTIISMLVPTIGAVVYSSIRSEVQARSVSWMLLLAEAGFVLG